MPRSKVQIPKDVFTSQKIIPAALLYVPSKVILITLHLHARFSPKLLDIFKMVFYIVLHVYIVLAYSESPAPINYNHNLGQFGASRGFPGSSYPGTQPYATQQVYNPSSGYQPHHYQSQHLIGTY